MAKLLKLRRGTTSQHSSFTGAEGEVTVDTDKEVLVVHDGSTAGGHAMAAQDMDNVPAGAILGTQLENSGVTAGQYGSSSAIPIVTVDAQGLVTAASTTAIDSTTIANGTSNVAVANNGDITTTRSGTARLKVDNAGVEVTGTLDISGQTNVNSGILRLGAADTASGHLNSYEVMTFNIDSDNDDTNRAFKWYKDGSSGSGTQLLALDESGTLTASGNVDCNSGLDVTAGHLTLPNQSSGNGKIKLGAGNDLQIYHNGTDSFIENSTGSLYIRDTSGGDVRIQGKSGEDSIICHDDDGVHLYYDNNVKLTTENHGISVTGSINVSGTVDGVDVAALNNTVGALGIASGAINSATTAVTQAASDNSTKVATTAYVTTGIANAQAFPSGTKMLFQQTAAPTGWTKVTSGVDNKALRVVSGTAGSGGTNAFSNTLASRGITANSGNTTAGGNISVGNTTQGGNVNISSVSTSGTVNSHTLTTNQIPSHSHSLQQNQRRGNSTNYRNNQAGYVGLEYINVNTRNYTHSGSANTNNTGNGGGHSHGFTGSSHNHNASYSGSAHNHNATFSGSAHNHSISVTNLDMAVQYLDVIIAEKD